MKSIIAKSATSLIALITLAQSAAAQTPATGIDPAVIRINAQGITQLGEEGVPYLLDAAGLDHVSIAGQSLFDQTITMDLGLPWPFDGIDNAAVRVRVNRGTTTLDIPLDADSVQFSLQGNGAANTGQVRCVVDAPDASVCTSIRIRVECSHPLLNLVPPDVRGFFNLDDTFVICACGANIDATVGVSKTASNQFAFAISSLAASVDCIEIEHSGLLDEIIDTLGLAACTIMGQPGGDCSLNTAATRLANHLLKGANTNTVRNAISSAVSNAVRGVGDIGGTVNVGFPGNQQLAFGTVLSNFNTAVNRFVAEWNLSAQRSSGAAFPNLSYSYLARTAQTPSSEAAAGDMQVWLPLSLFDKTAFELLKTGMLSGSFATPAANVNIGGVPVAVPSMTVSLSSPGLPRAVADAANPAGVRFAMAAGFQGTGASASCSLSSSLSVRLAVIESQRDLSWQLISIAASEPTGTLTIGGTTYSFSQLPSTLRSQIRLSMQNAMQSQWQQMAGTAKLMDNVIDLGDGWELGISGVQVGSRYLRVNFNIE
ncbi:MAG: hypothetical protein ACKVS9_10185 [Phycisphaerae bacterium]